VWVGGWVEVVKPKSHSWEGAKDLSPEKIPHFLILNLFYFCSLYRVTFCWWLSTSGALMYTALLALKMLQKKHGLFHRSGAGTQRKA